MAGDQLPSFHDTYVGILQHLELLRRIYSVNKNSVDSSSKIINEVAKSKQNAPNSVTDIDIAINRNRICPTLPGVVSACDKSFRKRKRKQERDKICRLDLVKAEDDNLLDFLKIDECQQFHKYFSEEFPNLVPRDTDLNKSVSLNEKLEVCKTLTGLAGRLLREKSFLLQEECGKVHRLERALSEESRLKDELNSELVVLEDRLAAVLSATKEGSESKCLYCSSVLGELGKPENQIITGEVLKQPKTEDIDPSEAVAISVANILQENKISEDLALEEGLASNGGVIYSKALPLNPMKMELDDSSQEMERNMNSEIERTSNGLSTVTERSLNNRVSRDSKGRFAFSELHQPDNVNRMHLQREITENIEEIIQYDRKAIDNKQSHANTVVGIKCRNSVGNGIEEENGAAENKESQPKFLTNNVIRKELDGSSEDSKGTGLCNKRDRSSLSGLKGGHKFIEMKCGCTSPQQIDTLGTLRVYDSGVFEVYCECMKGCDKGKPMTPISFERHAGRGASRKWKYSIWVLVGDQKIQVSKAKILEPYYQKRKAMKIMRTAKPGITGQGYHRDVLMPRAKLQRKTKEGKTQSEEKRRSLHS